MSRYLLGIDQGTSGTKALVLDPEGGLAGFASRPVERLYPQPGHVEHDPHAVAAGTLETIEAALDDAGIGAEQLAGCGITCQRGTIFAWDAATREPIGNAIVWQDLRVLPLLAELADWPRFDEARQRLGFLPGPYMGALHLAWRLRHEPALAAATRDGSLRVGLSAAWLVAALGRPAAHRMDRSLVQATGMYDFRADVYWSDWLEQLGIPRDPLPEPTDTIADYGSLIIRGREVPVLAMIGDQQGALFGHGCRSPGDAECTHGTASYVNVLLGESLPDRALTSLYYAWHLEGQQRYCLEAATSSTGAAVRWMRDSARLFDRYEELTELARAVDDSDGVVFVPAFTGLEMPRAEPHARAMIVGMTLGHDRRHLARAFLESIGFQIGAILELIERDSGVAVRELRVGGGVSASDLACQIQADLLGIPVVRPRLTDTTAWAAALLAGLGSGTWPDPGSLPDLPGTSHRFEPRLDPATRASAHARWRDALDLVHRWARPHQP